MIFTLTDRQYNVLDVLTTDDYLIGQYTDSFLETLDINIPINSLSPDLWTEGNYVMCADKAGRKYWFTIVTFKDNLNSNDKTLACYSGTIDVMLEDAATISGKEQPFVWYFNSIFTDTGITIGTNELDGQKRTLEYTSTDKTNAEMLQFVLNGFDNAEARFEVEFKGSTPVSLKLNIYKHIGLTEPQTLLSDDNDSLTELERSSSIEELGTCLRLSGADVDGKNISLSGKYYEEKDSAGNILYYSPKADFRIYSVKAREKYYVDLPGKTDSEFTGYINRTYDSEAKTQDTLWTAGLAQLKKIDHTILTYEAKGLVSCSLGDNITIVAKTMKPEVMISARVTEFKFNDDDSSKNEYTFTNYVELESSISDMDTLVKELQEKLGVIEAKTKTFATTEQVNTVQGNVDTVNNGLSEIKKEVAGNTADIIEVGKTAVKQETVDLMQKALSDSLKAKTAEVQANLDATKSALQEQANKANELAETRYTEWQEGAAQTATDLAKVTTGLDTLDETVAKNGATLTTTTTDALAKAKQALTDAATAQGKADATALTVDKQTGSIEALTTKSNENSTAVAKVAQTAEELAELVATSQTTAEGALTKATEAKTTADGLAVSITKAQTTADSATEAANLAQATADGATTSITKVTTTAEGALKAANTAQSTANGLVATISAAQTTADSAVTKANTAQTTADGIKTAVTKAQTTADGAITKATSAQTTADGLKTTVASAQTAADKANTGLVATDKRVATLELTDKNFDVTIASVKTTAEKGVVDAAKANTGIADTNTKMAKLAVDVDAVELVAANAATKAELKVESDKITIGVKDAKDYATGEIAKVEVHTAYAWSPDGTDRFTTIYPTGNLLPADMWLNSSEWEDATFTGWYTGGRQYSLSALGISVGDTISFSCEIDNTNAANKLPLMVGLEFISSAGVRIAEPHPELTNRVGVGKVGISWLTTVVPEGTYQISVMPMLKADQTSLTNAKAKGCLLELGPYSIYTPSPLVDPANAYPHYVGTSLKGSDNPADYTWQLDPAYLSIMSEMALQGKLDNDSFYEALDGKVNTEDFLETQELAQTLSDSFKAFTTETFVAEINKLEERSDGLVVNLNNKLADFSFLTTYIKLGEEGLVIGANDSSLKMLLSKDKLAFIDGGETVAYFTNQSFFINRGAIVQSLQVGSHKMVKLNDEHTIFQFVSAS